MILVVQFRQDITEAHEQQCIRRRLDHDEPVNFVSIFDTSIDFSRPEQLLSGISRLVLGGSAGLSMGTGHLENDYEKVDYIFATIAPLIKYILATDFPTLGTCFGHQLLAHFAGGTVVYDMEQAETGVFDVALTDEGVNDPIFTGLPKVFSAIEGHQDSVAVPAPSSVILASSTRSPVQAVRYGNNVYGTQFHSELNEEDLAYRLSLFPEYTAHASSESMDIAPSPYGVLVLSNFLNTRTTATASAAI